MRLGRKSLSVATGLKTFRRTLYTSKSEVFTKSFFFILMYSLPISTGLGFVIGGADGVMFAVTESLEKKNERNGPVGTAFMIFVFGIGGAAGGALTGATYPISIILWLNKHFEKKRKINNLFKERQGAKAEESATCHGAVGSC